MTEEQDMVKYIEQEFSFSCFESGLEELVELLGERINQLLLHDPKALVNIFYRLDINESQVNQLMAANNSLEASQAIAKVVIVRQVQKLKSKNDFPANEDGIDENERW